MSPLRHQCHHPPLAQATSTVPDGRGRRTPQTLLLIDERDKLLIEAAYFFPGTSQREAARAGNRNGVPCVLKPMVMSRRRPRPRDMEALGMRLQCQQETCVSG